MRSFGIASQDSSAPAAHIDAGRKEIIVDAFHGRFADNPRVGHMVVLRDKPLHALLEVYDGVEAAEPLFVAADALILRSVHALACVQQLHKRIRRNADCADAANPLSARLEELLAVLRWNVAVIVRRESIVGVFVLEVPVIRRIFRQQAVAARLVVVDFRNGANNQLAAVRRPFDSERVVPFGNVPECLKPRRLGGDGLQ